MSRVWPVIFQNVGKSSLPADVLWGLFVNPTGRLRGQLEAIKEHPSSLPINVAFLLFLLYIWNILK